MCLYMRSYCGLAMCALVSSGILIFEPLKHSKEITLQFRSSHLLITLCWLLKETPVISFTSVAECHRLSMLSKEPKRSQITLRYSSRVSIRRLIMIGNESLLEFLVYGHGAEGLSRNPSCRKAICSSTSCRLRVIFEWVIAISS